jgi:hypothetical protein
LIINVSAGGADLAGSKLQNSILTMLLLFRLNPRVTTEDVWHRIHIGEDLIIDGFFLQSGSLQLRDKIPQLQS